MKKIDDDHRVFVKGKSWKWGIVKNHVRPSGLKKDEFLWKDDVEIVYVYASVGETRRPLDIDLMARDAFSGDSWYYKADEVFVENDKTQGTSKYNENIRQIGGVWYHVRNLIHVAGHYYLQDDAKIIWLTDEQQWALVDNIVYLDESYYPSTSPIPVLRNRASLFNNRWVRKRDTIEVHTHQGLKKLIFWEGGGTLRYNDLPAPPTFTAFIGGTPIQQYCDPTDLDNFYYNSLYGIRCYPQDKAQAIENAQYYLFDDSQVIRLQQNLNANYADKGPDENNATTVFSDYKQYGGGVKLHPNKAKPVISATYKATGGIKYTFGVEMETSAGYLKGPDLEALNIEAWGDRSIGAKEYVTPPLSGDKGLVTLKNAATVISKRCLVDDRCSTHIHVGGWDDPRIDSPSFNRMFSMTALKLGTTIEQDLFKLIPKNRRVYSHNGHDVTLKPWKNMTYENADAALATFVFGRGRQRDGFDMFFDVGHNSKVELGRWNAGRYRWLNLIHCNTASRMNTIELRLFPGTTSRTK
jgi:hypothetical protein